MSFAVSAGNCDSLPQRPRGAPEIRYERWTDLVPYRVPRQMGSLVTPGICTTESLERSLAYPWERRSATGECDVNVDNVRVSTVGARERREGDAAEGPEDVRSVD